MIVGCYVLDLYCTARCDEEREREAARRLGGTAGQFTGASKVKAYGAAMRAGWVFARGEAWCSQECLNPKATP